MARTNMNGERMWLRDDGQIVCERPDCMPSELATKLRGQRTAATQSSNRHVFHLLNETDLQEYAQLLAASHRLVMCTGHHVYYNPESHTIERREGIHVHQGVSDRAAEAADR